MWDNPDVLAATLWIVAGVLLLILEMFTPGFAAAVFGIACIFAGALAYFDVSFNGQLIGFAVMTLVLFVTVRPLVLKYMDRGRHVRTNVDALIGKVGVVTQRIDPETLTGRVVVEGDDWRAVPIEEATIEQGQRVDIVAVKGTKLFVKPRG